MVRDLHASKNVYKKVPNIILLILYLTKNNNSIK